MIYNYKSDKIVQDIVTDDLNPIIEDIETEFTKLRRGECIGIYAPSTIAKEILGNLLEDIDDISVHEEAQVELLLDDKSDVLVTMWSNGELFVENAYNEKHLISCEGVINYIYDSFKKSFIDKFAENDEAILTFGLKEEPIEKSDIKEYDKDGFHITIKGNLDLYEAYAKLDEMEARISRMDDMFNEMNYFKRLFNW